MVTGPGRVGGAWLRTLALAGMAGCVVVVTVGLVRAFLPQWDGSYLVVLCVLASLESSWSYRGVRRQVRSGRVSGLKWLRFLELLSFFVALKVFGYARDLDLLAELQQMSTDSVCAFFDPETILGFALVYLSWYTTNRTLLDFDLLASAPNRYEHSGEAAPGRALLFPIERLLALDEPSGGSPAERIANRYFWSGGVVLAMGGLARIGLAGMPGVRDLPWQQIVPPVLLYFVLGLALLGQSRLAALRQAWRERDIRVTGTLARRWARGSLAFFGLAALIALLLPTAYTVGLLETAALVLGVGAALVWYAFSLLLWPFAWLISQLFQFEDTPPPPTRPELPPEVAQGPGLFGLLSSLAFWGLLLAVAVYVIRNILREHPEWAAMFAGSRPGRAIRRLWRLLRWWLRGWLRGVRIAMPRFRRASSGGPAPARAWRGRIPFGRLSARERVLYYYLSIVERAGREGLPRRPPQTPYEYKPMLVDRVPAAEPDVQALTDAFVEARYSAHALAPEEVAATQRHWQQVRAALQALRRRRKAERGR